MNKIVKEHYPASKLPVELREGIDPQRHVTVTVVEEENRRTPTRERLKQLLNDARSNAEGIRTEDAVARIRELRDEWDD
ncbi:MAG: hypothetical protein AB7U38_09130 [Hyphomicrobiales bacterium]